MHVVKQSVLSSHAAVALLLVCVHDHFRVSSYAAGQPCSRHIMLFSLLTVQPTQQQYSVIDEVNK